ncbi:hypothetical protein NPIL_614371 [Nephila pilipes]|uniref:Uncharacterized protein n=1 Tax=Nephila pilipes TaxID=299642 RepID=A0A8X6UIV2_NEPPI|nr:hypothetical protein NPIL_614371 [Nephila pilipes]
MPRIEVQPGMTPEDRFRDGAIFEAVGVDLAVLENNGLQLGLKGLLSKFNPEEGDMAMVLLSFCTPTEILKNSEETWAPYLTDSY